MPARGTHRCFSCKQFRQRSDFIHDGTLLGMCTRCAEDTVPPVLAAKLRLLYGLTALQYAAMRIAQNYRCAIYRKRSPLHVDHCHVTGQVRALVCRQCNTAMGMFGDDPDRMQAAVDYLIHHRQLVDESPPDMEHPCEEDRLAYEAMIEQMVADELQQTYDRLLP